MDTNQLEKSIAYCGLICGLCRPDKGCSCKTDNHCGKRIMEGCFQYDCCRAKGIHGCWECADAPCGIDMMAADKIKLRAFIRCIQEDGIEQFARYLTLNDSLGIVYHKKGIWGDYDQETEEAVLDMLRNKTAG